MLYVKKLIIFIDIIDSRCRNRSSWRPLPPRSESDDSRQKQPLHTITTQGCIPLHFLNFTFCNFFKWQIWQPLWYSLLHLPLRSGMSRGFRTQGSNLNVSIVCKSPLSFVLIRIFGVRIAGIWSRGNEKAECELTGETQPPFLTFSLPPILSCQLL